MGGRPSAAVVGRASGRGAGGGGGELQGGLQAPCCALLRPGWSGGHGIVRPPALAHAHVRSPILARHYHAASHQILSRPCRIAACLGPPPPPPPHPPTHPPLRQAWCAPPTARWSACCPAQSATAEHRRPGLLSWGLHHGNDAQGGTTRAPIGRVRHPSRGTGLMLFVATHRSPLHAPLPCLLDLQPHTCV